MTAILINLKPLMLTDDQFFDLCQSNQDLNLEFTSLGELVVMSPVGGESGRSELRLGAKVYNWNEASELGYTFSSSTVFKLPDGSKRSPDVAWVEASWISQMLPTKVQKLIRLLRNVSRQLRLRSVLQNFGLEFCNMIKLVKITQ